MSTYALYKNIFLYKFFMYNNPNELKTLSFRHIIQNYYVIVLCDLSNSKNCFHLNEVYFRQ